MNVLVGPSDPKVIWDLFSVYTGKLAFDVGANGGTVARLLAERFSQVIAFEPNLDSYLALCHKLPINIEPVHMAVSDVDGRIMLRRAEEAAKHGEYVTGASLESSWGTDLGPVVVDAVTLDKAAEAYGPADFVKIDTEGHEAHVVRGGLTFLQAAHPRLLIEVHDRHAGDEIHDLLPDYRLRPVLHPHYREDQPERLDHYWLIGEAR